MALQFNIKADCDGLILLTDHLLYQLNDKICEILQDTGFKVREIKLDISKDGRPVTVPVVSIDLTHSDSDTDSSEDLRGQPKRPLSPCDRSREPKRVRQLKEEKFDEDDVYYAGLEKQDMDDYLSVNFEL